MKHTEINNSSASAEGTIHKQGRTYRDTHISVHLKSSDCPKTNDNREGRKKETKTTAIS